MIDLNTIISNALTAAINNAVSPLNERIAVLESACATQHNDMVTMRVRIAALEAKTNEANMAKFVEGETLAALAVTDIVGEDRVAQIESRIAALENNPAQGVDTQATQYTLISKEQFKEMLETMATKDALVEYLDNQEWFWEKLQNRIDSTVEAGIDDHCQNYDHDDYDSVASKVGDMPDFDDYVTRDSVREEIEDVLNNSTLSISV